MSASRGRNNELGDFLRARRADISPDLCGLPTGHLRRVPGLRREEVAQLAAISNEYYTRLEQGRLPSASPAALDSIARALHLDADQTSYLHQLADKHATRSRARPHHDTRVRNQTQLLLDNLADTPALVLGRHMSVLAWNTLAVALYTDFAALPPAERNLLRLTFLDPGVRSLYADWESSARACVSFVRMDAALTPTDSALQALVGELSVRDEDFRRWWATHDVAHKTFGTKSYRHPVAGDLDLDWQILTFPHDPDQSLMVLSAPPGTPSSQALRFLASWATTNPAIHTDR
ncbi:transcriptional regulator [Streptomyces sp. WAC 04229]|uniref:helix-turn-helix domain-containing protein n=1 Tax=Streptomyces sp. WAC 04229 TaxID=2203206 RepID=UPI000F74A3CC|nr:helix-turn-helix transcriptional regulator [Streptomyces sp. WAC 04229]RSN53998.1 transcriptional regulator [Streptomyces sp. WAC 04229]